MSVSRTPASLAKLLGTLRNPTSQQMLMVSRGKGLQEAPFMRSQAVGVALQWAQDDGADSTLEAAPANSEPCVPPPDEIVELRGHRVWVTQEAI
eukprot:8780995-Pyramimonas_sp.AAC.1